MRIEIHIHDQPDEPGANVATTGARASSAPPSELQASLGPSGSRPSADPGGAIDAGAAPSGPGMAQPAREAARVAAGDAASDPTNGGLDRFDAGTAPSGPTPFMADPDGAGGPDRHANREADRPEAAAADDRSAGAAPDLAP